MEIQPAVPETIPSSSERKFDPANLRRRIASALVLAPVVLAAIYFGGLVYDLVVTLFMTLAMREWLRMVSPAAPRYIKLAAYFVLLTVFAFGAWQTPLSGAKLGAALCALLFLLLLAARAPKAGWILLGIPYLAGGGLALMEIRGGYGEDYLGIEASVYLFAVVWATDIGAFIAGRLIGGAKLAPKISPKKTWAGLYGGMAFAGIAGCLAYYGFQTVMHGGIEDTMFGIEGLLAVMVAIVAQTGDLFESFVKRHFGVKDSGHLIPGHGGALDRIDGLLFASFFLLLFRLVNSMTLQTY
jgi:phosphatidate cytidylyltransferase